MGIYIALSVSILILGLYLEGINSKADMSMYKKRLPNYFFIIPSFVILFIFSAFRGEFNSDYDNYVHLFELYNSYNFWDAFKLNEEQGYIFISRLIGELTTNPVYLFSVVSFITLVGYYSQFKKYSPYIWLSVLMFITVGSYLSSFNIIRQVLAASIIFSGSRFLYDRKLIKYILVVLAASLFHTTALIMIPFYFILNLRFKIKNIVLILFGSLFLVLFLDNIVDIVRNYLYTTYTDDAYGMKGQSIINAIMPISFMVFSLFNLNKLDMKDNIQKIWLNAVIFYAVFSILALQVQMIERVSHFFASYVLLLVPFIFSKMKPKELRFIYIMGLIFFLILYSYIVYSGTDYDPYYFIWETNR